MERTRPAYGLDRFEVDTDTPFNTEKPKPLEKPVFRDDRLQYGEENPFMHPLARKPPQKRRFI